MKKYIIKYVQKQPPRVVLRKRCFKNMQQFYKRTPMWKADFNKVAMQQICRETPMLEWDFNNVVMQLY